MECKNVQLRVHSHLSCYKPKIGYYESKSLYLSLMVTTKQKAIVATRAIMRKEACH